MGTFRLQRNRKTLYNSINSASFDSYKTAVTIKKLKCLDKNFNTKFEDAVCIPKPFKILNSKLGVLLHISVVMWLGDAIEFFYFFLKQPLGMGRW